MKKICIYSVEFDINEFYFKKSLTIFEIVKEKKDCYLVADENDKKIYKDISMIWKEAPYLKYGYANVQNEKIEAYYNFYSGFLFENNKEFEEKKLELIQIVDEEYKDILDEFFSNIDKMKYEYVKKLF